jgi:hypothetical protein
LAVLFCVGLLDLEAFLGSLRLRWFQAFVSAMAFSVFFLSMIVCIGGDSWMGGGVGC